MSENFAIDISNFCKKAENNLRRFQFRFAQNLFLHILQNHPVETGFLRSSWNVGINKVDMTLQGVAGTVGSPSAIPDGRIQVALLPVLQGGAYEVNFTNTANYAYFVEYGTSKMDGRAFIRQAIAAAPTIANQTIAELDR